MLHWYSFPVIALTAWACVEVLLWFDSGSTMLYCMPHIKSKGHYLRNFEIIQPRLRTSIHGASHPPGASLALYWAGKPFGATASIGDDRLRYALGMTLFTTFSVR